MKIEVGKKYRDRTGETFVSATSGSYRHDGGFMPHGNSKHDLVEEVVEAPAPSAPVAPVDEPEQGIGPLKIAVGKRYRTRDGKIAEVTAIWPDNDISYKVRGHIGSDSECWTFAGAWDLHAVSPRDLVEEIAEVNGYGGVDALRSMLRPGGPIHYAPPGVYAPSFPPGETEAFVSAIDPSPAVELLAALRYLLREVDNRTKTGRIEGNSPLADAAALARVVIQRHA